jgi:hypothetical protein
MAEYSNTPSIFRNMSLKVRSLSQNVNFGQVPDPYPLNASGSGQADALNYYVVGAQQ